MLRILILPAALVAGLALAVSSTADAAPLSSGLSGASGVAFGGTHIDIGVSVPIRGRHHRHARRTRVRHTGGYWVTEYRYENRRVYHGPELIGYDRHGYAVYSEGHWDIERVRVPVRRWVPHRRVVHRRVHRRPAGHITVGGRFRL